MSPITAASGQVVHRQISTVMHLQGRIMTRITLSFFYKGQLIRDGRQNFENNRGQGLANCRHIRDSNRHNL